ncbi:HU family DNA-binding protein [Sporolactobacillus putidus]|uniref:Transcriptional regulator n=1 Tax=Sporolactobacillus putidus TaxID=492735 RepID=A0A917S8B0_9BACL|nr:HU family DNA-binding protein [Sporolactobacillus putidus]GGL64188.1 transcriptional regulator [Sporolactobacillus putidus]
MNKNELIQKVAEKTGIAKKDTEVVVNETLDEIISALNKNEKVQFVGFGTFEVRERASRTGRNPQTGEAITIPATKVPGFRAGNKLKDAVKK